MIQVSIPLDEVIQWLKGTRMEVPPPFANLQASRGAERRIISWQVEPGGGWRCAGALGQIFVNAFKQRVWRGILGSNWSRFLEGSFHQVGWHPPDYGRWQGIFGKGVGRGRDSLQESESFIHSNRFACCILLSVLDTVWKTKVLENKPKKICFPAYDCSKELLESLWFFL